MSFINPFKPRCDLLIILIIPLTLQRVFKFEGSIDIFLVEFLVCTFPFGDWLCLNFTMFFLFAKTEMHNIAELKVEDLIRPFLVQ